MIKLIVSDLDGTLMDHNNHVLDSDLEALRLAKRNGIDLCLASGRMHVEMKVIMERVGFAAHGVSQNGAFVHLDDGQFLGSHLFAPEIAAQVYELAQSFELVMMVGTGESNYVDRITPEVELLQARLFADLRVREDLGTALHAHIPCCKFSIYGEQDELRAFKKQLEHRMGDQTVTFQSEVNCLDVVPPHVSKGRSLLDLLDQIGLKPEEAACVGDAFNDVSMFGVTPHSFAMHTAHPDVQKAAAYRVQSVAEVVTYALEYNASLERTR